MGKTKKGKKKVKNATSTPPQLEPWQSFAWPPPDGINIPQFLGDQMAYAKHRLLDVYDQSQFCELIMNISRTHPEAYQYYNYKSEVPITILVALEKHSNDTDFRQRAYCALLSLIDTRCAAAVFRYGSKVLKNYMEDELESEGFQRRFFHILNKLPSHLWDISRREIYDNLGKVDFHEVVIKVMKSHIKNSEILLRGANILASLIKFTGNAERLAKIRDDTVGILLAAVDSSVGDPHLAYCFCQTLCIIMEECPTAFPPLDSKHNGTRKVLSMMERHPEIPKIQGSCCSFLTKVANYTDLLSDCFSAVMDVLKSSCNDAEIRRRGMFFVLTITTNGPESGEELVFESGHLPFFLELMNQYYEFEVQAVGCTILETFTYKHEAKEPINLKEAAHLLAKALKTTLSDPAEKELLHLGVLAIAKLLAWGGDSETVAGALLEEDAYSYLAAGMEFSRKNDEFFSDEEACDILLDMAKAGRNEIRLEIATSGCAAVIIDCMKQNPGDQEIQTLGCEALGEVTINKDPQIFEAISKVDGANILLDAVDRFPKNKTIFNFGGSAAILTREYEDDKKYGKLDLSRF